MTTTARGVGNGRTTKVHQRDETHSTTTATTIGFVGLGHMGGNMADRLLEAGYEVYGEARSRDGEEALERDGLRWRDTPREVAESAEIIFTSLPDDDVLGQVAAGPD